MSLLLDTDESLKEKIHIFLENTHLIKINQSFMYLDKFEIVFQILLRKIELYINDTCCA